MNETHNRRKTTVNGLTANRRAVSGWSESAVLAIAFVLASSTGLAQEKQDLKVAKTLIPLDGDSAAKRADWVKITSEKVTFKNGDTVPKLVGQRGFIADGEVLGVVYDLNPRASADSIRPGTELVLPVASMNAKLKSELEAGFRIQLTTNLEQKQAFLQTLKKLELSTSNIAESKGPHGERPADRERFVRAVKSTTDGMAIFKTVIIERSRPLNAEVLDQLNAEASELDALLGALASSKRHMNKADLDKAALIAADVEIKARPFGEKKGDGDLPRRWPEVRVVVRTLDPKKGAEVHNLRVFYVPQALAGDPKFVRSFDRLTSPTTRSLPEADYYIWATQPSESALVTEKKTLEVRAVQGEDTIKLDLAVQ